MRQGGTRATCVTQKPSPAHLRLPCRKEARQSQRRPTCRAALHLFEFGPRGCRRRECGAIELCWTHQGVVLFEIVLEAAAALTSNTARARRVAALIVGITVQRPTRSAEIYKTCTSRIGARCSSCPVGRPQSAAARAPGIGRSFEQRSTRGGAFYFTNHTPMSKQGRTHFQTEAGKVTNEGTAATKAMRPHLPPCCLP